LARNITLKEIQSLIRSKDHNSKLKDAYFYKLVEEVGELGNALRKHNFMEKPSRYIDTKEIKGSIEEELYDVLYYVAAIANLHEIELEDCFILKDEYNSNRNNVDG
jgi:NTP pyrophosphatase (non-canonical NTP hydrolase)